MGSNNVFGDVFIVSNEHAIFRATLSKKASSESVGRSTKSNMKYVVYRVLLYCEDFQPFSSLLPYG